MSLMICLPLNFHFILFFLPFPDVYLFCFLNSIYEGIPGWLSGLVPAFGPGRDPGDLGSNPTSGSPCMEPASPSAYVSASLSVSLMNK